MKTRNAIRNTLLFAICLLPASGAVRALAGETLSGTWEGHMVSQKGRIPANAAFNWKTGKSWNFTTPAGVAVSSWAVTLDIDGPFDNLTGTYTAKDKKNAKVWGKYEFDGNFNFGKKLMTWTPGKLVEGPTKLANTVIRSVTYSRDDDFEYLKGRWASQDGFTGVMEFRRPFDGTELKDQKEVVADFVLPDTDADYVIKKGDWFLALNDDKDGIVSKKDAAEGVRKWKLAPMPGGAEDVRD